MIFTDVAVVVIGRNEGARLDLCLGSLGGLPSIYVDSGSSDGSPDRAHAAGIETIELDPATGFSAARGRNAGIERLIADPAIAYIQVIDGDCVLEPGWIAAGKAALDADPGLGAVFGRRRERDPQASVYSWMSDIEWALPPGPADAFGGDVLFRAAAIRDTGRYREGMIAGEDPDFSLRMRGKGWRLLSLDAPMTVHDVGIGRFGPWWRRTVRAGHAFAELAALHRVAPAHGYARSRARILVWAGLLPMIALAGLVLGLASDRRWLLLPLAALLLTAAQMLRVTIRESRRHGLARGATLALFLTIGKYAEMAGLIRYHHDRLRGRAPRLIEYKAP